MLVVSPTPLFPKLAWLATSALGFAVALLAAPAPEPPPPEPRLLASYVYDPGGHQGAVVDLGQGPINLPLGRSRDGVYLTSLDESGAVVRVDGERHKLPWTHPHRDDHARREAPPRPPKADSGGGCVRRLRLRTPNWSRPASTAQTCSEKRGALWTPVPCGALR